MKQSRTGFSVYSKEKALQNSKSASFIEKSSANDNSALSAMSPIEDKSSNPRIKNRESVPLMGETTMKRISDSHSIKSFASELIQKYSK